MKITKTVFLFVALSAFAFGCSKSDSDDGPACEENETTKVTFSNNGSSSLRLAVATQFDAQYNPISPVFTFDIAAGTSSTREFAYGHYFIQWKANCATTCTPQAFYAKTFDKCQEYQETQ